MATDFTKSVIKIIKKIPKGKVATYGQVAKLAGKPLGARGVVWVLHSSSTVHDLPWHRVINAKGKISFGEMSSPQLRQMELLKLEGVVFGEGHVVDLKAHQWIPKNQRS